MAASLPLFHWKREPVDTRDKIYKPAAIALPKTVDLRQYCSPIEDQGQLGSCTGNAIAGLVECLDRKAGKNLTVSRLFIYYEERVTEGTVTQDSGAYIRDGIKVVNKKGAPLESIWPYNINKFAVRPNAAAYADGLKRTASSYEKCADFAAVKNALARGFPVVIGFDVYDSFYNIGSNGIMTYPNTNREQLLGGHAVALVGYDDNKNRFIARNSWGTSWGDHGYFYMPYRVIQDTNMSSDFWIITGMNNPASAPAVATPSPVTSTTINTNAPARVSVVAPVNTMSLPPLIPGPVGAKGDTGAQGPQGPQGPKGDKGDQGPPGQVTTVAGNVVTGPQGLQGEKGDTGPQGERGEQGPQGIQGEVGPQGPAGKDGIDGKDGAQGPQGPQGIAGKDGAQGIQGPQGVAGPVGATGAVGPQGPKGDTGAAGLQGPQGIQGIQGPKGDTGAMGPVGTTGAMNTATFTAPVVNGVTAAGTVIATYTFTSNGFPVLMIANGDANPVAAGGQWAQVQWFRDGIAIGNKFHMESVGTNVNVSYCVTATDTPAAGAHTYTLRTVMAAGSWNFGEAGGAQLTFVELSGATGPTGPAGVGIKGFASGYVDAGQFVTLDNLKFSVTTGGQRGLSCATVSGTSMLAISASYAMINGGRGGDATNWASMPVYTTTPSSSWFGWSFPNAGDGSTYNIQEVATQRFYRVTLMIGPGYTKNFISIERLG